MKKTRKIRDQENEALIKLLLGMSDIQYKLYRLQKMENYLVEYCRGNYFLYELLLSSDAFEAWYINHWNRVNNWLIHRYSLKSYRNRVKKGLKIRISWDRLIQKFHEIHEYKITEIYPSSAVYELIEKEAKS